MPNTLSAKKRLRQNDVRRLRNRKLVSRLKTALKKFAAAPTVAEQEALLPQTFSALDRAVRQGIVHRNKADRKKSQAARTLEKAKASAAASAPSSPV